MRAILAVDSVYGGGDPAWVPGNVEDRVVQAAGPRAVLRRREPERIEWVELDEPRPPEGLAHGKGGSGKDEAELAEDGSDTP